MKHKLRIKILIKINMSFLKVFNISNKKLLIYDNKSFDITKNFENHSNFSLYVPEISKLFWIKESGFVIELENYKYDLIDIFFPDLICPISNSLLENPKCDINGYSYDTFNILQGLKDYSINKKKCSSKHSHILQLCSSSSDLNNLYINRNLLSTINIIKLKLKFEYTNKISTINTEDIEKIFFDSICPISLSLSTNNLITPTGHSYDSNFLKKLKINNYIKCPLTKKTFSFIEIYKNNILNNINSQLLQLNIIDYNKSEIIIGLKENLICKEKIDFIFKIIVENNFWFKKKTMCKLYQTLFLIPQIGTSTIPFYISILVSNINENENLDLIKKAEINFILNNKNLLTVYYSSLELKIDYLSNT